MVPALVTPLLPISMPSRPINMVLLLILFYIKNMLAKLWLSEDMVVIAEYLEQVDILPSKNRCCIIS